MKNKQTIFNISSIIFLSFIILFYVVRFIYFKIESSKTIIYSNILSERIIQEDKHFNLTGELMKNNKTYYFYGKSKNNYVDYNGLIWRIVKINEDKTITLILENPINNMPYSSVMKWMNEGTENNTGIFQNVLNRKELENIEQNNDLNNKNTLTCDRLSNDRLYLLDVKDYINAGAEDSYLNNKTDFWLLNNKFVENDGLILKEENNEYHNIRPVIILDSDVEISKGNGSIDNPYYIKRDKVNTLKDVYTNSYIEYNDMVWKVIQTCDGKIKIASEECIKDKNDKCISTTYSNYSNKVTLRNSENLLYYLNKIYYYKLDNREYLTEGTFYVGKYEDDNYLTIFDDSIDLNVGLLTLADPYAFEIDNTFLLTSSKNSNLSIFIALDNHPYETLISEEANIRPVLHLKNNISIESGDGTYSSPYILGGLIDEEK